MKQYKVSVLTMNNTESGEFKKDESGLKIIDFVEERGMHLVSYNVIPDKKEIIHKKLIEMCDSGDTDLIFTTGTEGLSKRDVTPEVTRKIIEKEAENINEAMKYCAMQKVKRGMLSRSVSGIRKDTLIVNMPGNTKVTEEALHFIFDSILDVMIRKESNYG